LSIDNNRLPKQAYVMLTKLDENGKACWVSQLRGTLCQLGFGYAWIYQGVASEENFLALLRQRLIDTFLQEWHCSVTTKEMYQHYSHAKVRFEPERYLEYVDVKCFRNCLTKLRIGNLPLNGATLKCFLQDNIMNDCVFCNNHCIEDEEHFVCHCPLYINLRKKYFNADMCDRHDYNNMRKCRYSLQSRKLGAYIFYALRLRNEYVEMLSCKL